MNRLRTCNPVTQLLVLTLVIALNALFLPLDRLIPKAQAAETVSAYILGYALDGDRTTPEVFGSAADAVEDILKAEGKVKLLSTSEAKERLEDASDKPTASANGTKDDLKKARKYLKRSKEYWTDGNVKKSLAQAKKAVRQFTKAANLVGDWDEVKEAFAYAAMAAYEYDDEDAETYMRTLFMFDPEFKPEGEFKAMNKLYKKVSKKEFEAKLTVTCKPKGATVMLNGREFQCKAEVKNLAGGYVFLRVESEQHVPYADAFKIPDDEYTDKHIVLQSADGDDKDLASLLNETRDMARNGEWSDAFVKNCKTLGEAMGVDYFVTGYWKSKNKTSRFYPLVVMAMDKSIGKVDSEGFKFSHGKSNGDVAEAVGVAVRDAIVTEFPTDRMAVGGATPDAEGEGEDEPVAEEQPEEIVEEVALDVDKSFLFSKSVLGETRQDMDKEEEVMPPDTPYYKTWWFITLVSVGAAAVVGGLVTTAIVLQPEDNSKADRISLPAY